jgi:hypothetical protein
MQVKKKNAIIQRIRAGRKHSNWLRSLLKALPKIFSTPQKDQRDPFKANGRSGSLADE